MPRTVNVHEAKNHLSRLLAEVRRGEPVIIAKAGGPIAELVPLRRRKEPRSNVIDALRGILELRFRGHPEVTEGPIASHLSW